MVKSLKFRDHPLAQPIEQISILEQLCSGPNPLPRFEDRLKSAGCSALTSGTPEILQVNIGYQCNQTCAHCHVDAGPDRRERMTEETMNECLAVLKKHSFTTLDITGGAPEMHSHFKWFVAEARKTSVKEIIVRSNLTILVSNPVYYDLPEFFSENTIRVCSSLPFYQASRTDRQRGEGVFEKSIRALKMLNAVGYGKPTTGLQLDLIYNPSGAFLPSQQGELEIEFKKVLKENHDVEFNQLLAITNVPISRFLDYLMASGNLESYMEKLISGFNPSTVKGLMCRNTISVDWQGNLYDCDFNQMLALGSQMLSAHISCFEPAQSVGRRIASGLHCYACTAGSGSSCQGTTI